jgi:hypothetical protein
VVRHRSATLPLPLHRAAAPSGAAATDAMNGAWCDARRVSCVRKRRTLTVRGTGGVKGGVVKFSSKNGTMLRVGAPLGRMARLTIARHTWPTSTAAFSSTSSEPNAPAFGGEVAELYSQLFEQNAPAWHAIGNAVRKHASTRTPSSILDLVRPGAV